MSRGYRQVVGVFGATGTGKTQATRARMRPWKRRIVHDPMADFEEGKDVEKVCYSRSDVVDYLEGLEEGEAFSVAYRPPAEDPEPESAGFLSRLAWGARDCVLVLDEAHVACGQVTCSPHVLLLARRGRHRNVSLIVVSQRPTDVHTSLRAECFACEVWLFRLARRADLQEVAQERTRALSEEVAVLPRLRCVRTTPMGGVERWRVVFRGGRPHVERRATLRGNVQEHAEEHDGKTTARPRYPA